MYFILSITRWSVNSKHYYGKLYSSSGSCVNLNNLYAGFYDNYDFRKQFEDLAFESMRNVKVKDMLAHAKKCKRKNFYRI